MKIPHKALVILTSLTLFIHCSCKKFLDIDAPKNSATSSQVFDNDETATSAIIGIYTRMSGFGAFSGNQNSLSVLNGLSSDELISYSPSLDVFYKNDIPTNQFAIDFYLWSQAYAFIYTSNSIIEGLEKSTNISMNVRSQLKGEAKFVRAFCYFYLVNIFGDVPLNLSTDYTINEKTGRTPLKVVYEQIVRDLVDSENLLSDSFVGAERIRPSKWAAKALLSRVYLYSKNWQLAIEKASDVIGKSELFELLENLDQVFLKNSKEAIWQLMPAVGNNTQEGSLFILNNVPTRVSLSPDLASALSAADKRKINWIGEYTFNNNKYYYPYKYKIRQTTNGVVNEYSMVLRLAELFLIRAECNAKLSKPIESLRDINIIRKRAGFNVPLTNLNSEECLKEVSNQRRFELFTEWGHRWLDLKRTDMATFVLAPLKPTTWVNTDTLYPIPDSEVNRNRNVTQNLGY